MLRKNAVLLILSAALASAGGSAIIKADLGEGISDKYEVVKPARVFANDTPEIVCVWKADTNQGAIARGVWIAEDVGKIVEPNYKILEASIKVSFSREGKFSLSKPTNGWPVGKYRLEIYIADKFVKSVPFWVKAK